MVVTSETLRTMEKSKETIVKGPNRVMGLPLDYLKLAVTTVVIL